MLRLDRYIDRHRQVINKQDVALMGRNTTGPQCSGVAII